MVAMAFATHCNGRIDVGHWGSASRKGQRRGQYVERRSTLSAPNDLWADEGMVGRSYAQVSYDVFVADVVWAVGDDSRL